MADRLSAVSVRRVFYGMAGAALVAGAMSGLVGCSSLDQFTAKDSDFRNRVGGAPVAPVAQRPLPKLRVGFELELDQVKP